MEMIIFSVFAVVFMLVAVNLTCLISLYNLKKEVRKLEYKVEQLKNKQADNSDPIKSASLTKSSQPNFFASRVSVRMQPENEQSNDAHNQNSQAKKTKEKSLIEQFSQITHFSNSVDDELDDESDLGRAINARNDAQLLEKTANVQSNSSRSSNLTPSNPQPSVVTTQPTSQASKEEPADKSNVAKEQVNEPTKIVQKPSFISNISNAITRWFTSGNLPVKVGMLVLFGGVIALLNHANKEGYFTAPIWLRMFSVIGVAFAALVFAWFKRDSKRSFSLSVQGGSIGIMLLTVYASDKLYFLLPPNIGFIASLGLIVLMGVLASIQNAKFLAVFSLLAGFLAPIVFSSGSGDYVALFSYYALLNIAITVMAWWRSWRFVNLLGFFFTFGLVSLWGFGAYVPEMFNTIEPFLVLYFVIYLLIPIFFIKYQMRSNLSKQDTDESSANYDLFERLPQITKMGFSDPLMVDSGLVFGTPLVAFGLQSYLVEGMEMALTYSALGLTVLYAVLAWFFIKRSDSNSPARLLGQSFTVLAVGFFTIFVLLGFSDNAITGILALEGAAGIWIGLRQRRVFSQWSGIALQGLAFLYWSVGLGNAVESSFYHGTFYNEPLSGTFFSGLLLTTSLVISAWLYAREKVAQRAISFYISAVLFGVLTGCLEIVNIVIDAFKGDIHQNVELLHPSNPEIMNILIISLFAFLFCTSWLVAEIYKRSKCQVLDEALGVTMTLGAAAGFLFAGIQTLFNMPIFEGYALLTWLLYLLVIIRSLVCVRGHNSHSKNSIRFMWLAIWPYVLTLAVFMWLQGKDWAQGWVWLALIMPSMMMMLICLLRWKFVLVPFGFPLLVSSPITLEQIKLRAINQQVKEGAVKQLFNLYYSFTHLLMAVLGVWWLLGIVIRGSNRPLPWIPIANPLELMQIMMIVMGMYWLRSLNGVLKSKPKLLLAVELASFVYLSSVVIRCVHYWVGIPWDASIINTDVVQTSLTVLWSVLGVIAWIIGSRYERRTLWLVGAILMAVVLFKLFLIDRTNLGNVLGIASFIAYGLLCTVVGYIAPAPPKTTHNSG